MNSCSAQLGEYMDENAVVLQCMQNILSVPPGHPQIHKIDKYMASAVKCTLTCIAQNARRDASVARRVMEGSPEARGRLGHT